MEEATLERVKNEILKLKAGDAGLIITTEGKLIMFIPGSKDDNAPLSMAEAVVGALGSMLKEENSCLWNLIKKFWQNKDLDIADDFYSGNVGRA